MPSDISRLTFNPQKRYGGVRWQQERVLLDSDWNEQLDARRHRAQTFAADALGEVGAPKKNNGFKISNPNGRLEISRGRIYVNGLLCELFEKEFVELDASLSDGTYVAYLETWQREATHLDDPAIQEVALGEADTTTRLQTVWQVKLFQLPQDSDGNVDLEGWEKWKTKRRQIGKLAARVQLFAEQESASEILTNTGYQGQENQLYRIEIHQGNTSEEGQATFKWSRNNATVESEIEEINGTRLTVSSIGKDEILGFSIGSWVEIIDKVSLLKIAPRKLLRIVDINSATREIEVEGSTTLKLDEEAVISGRYKLRQWDQNVRHGEEGQLIKEAWTDLEKGVQVKFSAGDFHTGDYWLIPARKALADIEWPKKVSDNQALEQAPGGVGRHYCKLALLRVIGEQLTVLEDCRPRFPALTELGAVDVYYDPAKWDRSNAGTVQKIIDEQYQRRAPACTYVVPPEPGWESVFDLIEEEASAHICFQTGIYEIEKPIRLLRKGHLKLSGCGFGTQIICRDSEACLVFEECKSVLAQELYAEAKVTGSDVSVSSSPNPLNGVLTFYQCETVLIENVRLKCAWGTKSNAACLVIRNHIDQGSVRIQNSEFEVGYLQQGIWLQNTKRVLIANNAISAYGNPDEVNLERLLADDDFKAEVRRFLISNPFFPVEGAFPEEPLFYPQMSLQRGSLGLGLFFIFRTHAVLLNAWERLFEDEPPEEVIANGDNEALANYLYGLADRILKEQTLREKYSAFDQFYKALARQEWSGGRLGISINGYKIEDIRIVNNSIDGFLQSIHVSSSGGLSGGTSNYNEHMTITGNTVRVLSPGLIHKLEPSGIAISNYGGLFIENNHIILNRLPVIFFDSIDTSFETDLNERPIEGVVIKRSVGRKMLVNKNRIDNFKSTNNRINNAISIFIDNNTRPADNFLWAVSWNILPEARISVGWGVGDSMHGSQVTTKERNNNTRAVFRGVIVHNNFQ